MPTAKDIMTIDVVTVSPNLEIIQAAKLLMEKRVNGFPVVEGEKLVGIICQSDLIAQQKEFPVPSLFSFLDGYISLTSGKHLESEIQKIAATSVGQAMTPNPVTVNPDTSIENIASLMVDKNFHTLPVVDQDRLVGIVGKEDVLRLLVPGPSE